jgi:hypothetical protein
MRSSINPMSWYVKPPLPITILCLGIVLGLLWILIDLLPSMGILGWLALIIVGLPLYFVGELAGSEAFSPERGEKLSKKTFSWKRVWYGLFLLLSVLLVAASLYYLSNVIGLTHSLGAEN